MTGDRRHPLAVLASEVVECDACPELRSYCAEVARTRRRAFADQTYWGRPVPGFGDFDAAILVVGLAPAAHGANRTGRMFTGDRSGDFLYAALHRCGLANQPTATSRADGLELRGVYITAPLRCAPPQNRPTTRQLARCARFLDAEFDHLTPPVTVCLGGIAWNAMLALLKRRGVAWPRPKPKFAHGCELTLGGTTLLGCYHVSQQNTFTGRLTPPMLDAVLTRAGEMVASKRG
ncbi:MAG: uracil-DNA glycosylase [Phycisphaerales bacterium]|nr:uracil-DNA glycosylase [Phycisphaerae bacterium]NNF44776.1 uracil-DNA glycosylase [Phycisphaerales bacterium]NNM24870.1 uracil-DNA glycosylase [Phycisphaerales bacterium]